MAFATTYGFNGLGTPTPINVVTPNSQYFSAAVLTDAGMAAVFYYSTANGGTLSARLVGPDGAGTGALAIVTTGVASGTDFTDGVASVTKLTNGNIVVTWADSDFSNAVHYRIYDENLDAVSPVETVDTAGLSGSHRHPDVAALTGGGFVIVWESNSGATEHDIFAQRYTNGGAADGARIAVNNSSGTFDELPSVAGLADGGFAIAHDRSSDGATTAWHAVYDGDGSVRLADAQFDAAGSTNTQMDVLGLSNGDYLITYTDNEWGDQDITSRRFNSSGIGLGTIHSGSLAETEDFPATAISPDGYVFVQHETAIPYDQYGALISPSGQLLVTNQVLANVQGDGFSNNGDEYWGSPVWLDASHVLATWGANAPAAGTTAHRAAAVSQVFEIVRTITGDRAGDFINTSADGLIDHVNGGGGRDNIRTGGGNDVINGQFGADIMRGGTGNDVYYVENTGDRVIELVGQGSDLVKSSITYTLTANVENLKLAGSASINGTGNALGNIIIGNNAANIIDGGDGNDSMRGGGGDDIYYVNVSGDRVVEQYDNGTDEVISTVTYALRANIENLTLAGTAAINGSGNGLANVMAGNSADNVIDGGGGADTLNGGLGSDQLAGGQGNDAFLFDTDLDSSGNVDTVTDFSRTTGNTDTILLDGDIFTAVASGAEHGLDADHFISGGTGVHALSDSQHIIYDTSTGWLYYDPDGNGIEVAVHFATLQAAPGLTNADFRVVL